MILQNNPFEQGSKNADIFTYMNEVFRVLNKNGSFIVFNDWKNLGDIVKYAEKLGFVTKDMLRLEKSNPMPRNRDRRYITDFECAIWFTMPHAKWCFNRQDPAYQRPKFLCPIDKGLHPTQKSLKLMQELVKIHSNEGDVILDCFAGSASCAVACYNTGRNFMGCELDETYYTKASERISKLYDKSTDVSSSVTT